MAKRYAAAVLGAALVTVLPGTIAAQEAGAVIAKASAAIGATQLNTIEFSGSGSDFALGQSPNPTAPWPRFTVKSLTRSLDFGGPAMRHSAIRLQAEDPPRGGGSQPIRGEQTQNQTVTATSPWAQQLQIWLTPHGFLKAAAAGSATVTAQTVGGRRFDVVSYRAQNKYTLNGYINDQGLVERIETWIENPILGDMPVEASFAEYKDFAGVKFPTRIVQRQGGHPTLDLTITEVKPNAPLPPAQGGGGAPAGQAGPQVGSQQLAEGVYAITGGYTAVAVEFRDHVVVIEGPQNEQRATAIIAETRKVIPSKPIRYVVNTHHHFDHSSGLPTFVAEGITIITHEINRAFYEKAFSAPRTLAPDKMAQSKRKPAFETMTDKKVLTDGAQILELHHIRGNGHNDGIIVAYLPKARILVEADVFNPPAQANAAPPMPPSPFNTNFVENLERLKLDYDQIVPVHPPADGRRITKADLMKFVGRTSSN